MTIRNLKVSSTKYLIFQLVAMFVCLAVDLTGSISAEAISPAPIMKITFKDDLISAELVDAPLIDVLQRLEQEIGFKAHFYGDLNELITLSFTNISLDKCLRRLTANHSLSVASLPILKSQGQKNKKQIAEIWVLSRSSTSKKSFNSPTKTYKAPSPTAVVAKTSPDLSEINAMLEEEALVLADEDYEENFLLDEILDNPNADRSSQRQTIQALVEMGDADSVLSLASYLDNEDKELRQLLVDGIGLVKNDSATQVLGQVLQAESDPEIRKTALRALAKRQSDNAAKSYMEDALKDEDEGVKTLASQLLKQ